ncbi:MAG: phosphatase PAP2 family protein, partial [Planctomycetes bacterium]|nr:phosphatase PAP2 family protein [Planctomycetota bacterium]
GIQNTFLDALMIFFTKNRFILFIAVLSPLFFKDWRKGLIVFTICVAGTIVASSSVSLLKQLFSKPRPCHTLENVRLLVACNSDFSLPSGHSATSFTIALIIGHLYKQAKIPAFIVAFIVAFSRIYVGVHYPSDVIAGAVWGGILAMIILILIKRFPDHFIK